MNSTLRGDDTYSNVDDIRPVQAQRRSKSKRDKKSDKDGCLLQWNVTGVMHVTLDNLTCGCSESTHGQLRYKTAGNVNNDVVL